jgi:predicted nucleic acid-binding protein
VIIVADASPLHYLILIERIELLAVLYRQVLVPDTVAGEMQHPRTPAQVQDWIAHPPSWLRIEVAHGPSDALPENAIRASATQYVWLLHAMSARS